MKLGTKVSQPHADLKLYRDHSIKRSGPSSFFVLTAALIFDSVRTDAQNLMRKMAAAITPKHPLAEIHWRKLSPAEKSYAANELLALDFCFITAIAHKPSLPQSLQAPYLYNRMVRIVLERACMHASIFGRDLVPTFSWRSRTNYVELEQYISSNMDAYGSSSCLRRFRTEQPKKERLLQLADICCGAVENALEHDRFGDINTTSLKILWPKVRRHGKKIKNFGIKTFPDDIGPCGKAKLWLDRLT